MMKRMLCIILACAACLLPVSGVQAKEATTVSPCGVTDCENGQHGVGRLVTRSDYGRNSTHHWIAYQQVAICDLCGVVLQVVKSWDDDTTKVPHTLVGGKCNICGYNPK